eukprot:4010296-Pleurochrysis_carterae.AAC.1
MRLRSLLFSALFASCLWPKGGHAYVLFAAVLNYVQFGQCDRSGFVSFASTWTRLVKPCWLANEERGANGRFSCMTCDARDFCP